MLPLTTEYVTLAQLAHRMGVPRRDAEKAIQEARLAGLPIISDSNGVRLARSSKEAQECAARLRSRAITQWVTARALRKTAARMAAAELQFESLTLGLTA